MVGANFGKRYSYNNSTNNIELYDFDEKNETYLKVLNSGLLTVPDFGNFPARATNGLVLTMWDLSNMKNLESFSDTVEHRDEIINLFQSLK